MQKLNFNLVKFAVFPSTRSPWKKLFISWCISEHAEAAQTQIENSLKAFCGQGRGRDDVRQASISSFRSRRRILRIGVAQFSSLFRSMQTMLPYSSLQHSTSSQLVPTFGAKMRSNVECPTIVDPIDSPESPISARIYFERSQKHYRLMQLNKTKRRLQDSDKMTNCVDIEMQALVNTVLRLQAESWNTKAEADGLKCISKSHVGGQWCSESAEKAPMNCQDSHVKISILQQNFLPRLLFSMKILNLCGWGTFEVSSFHGTLNVFGSIATM